LTAFAFQQSNGTLWQVRKQAFQVTGQPQSSKHADEHRGVDTSAGFQALERSLGYASFLGCFGLGKTRL
jgi:hypothetical protein